MSGATRQVNQLLLRVTSPGARGFVAGAIFNRRPSDGTWFCSSNRKDVAPIIHWMCGLPAATIKREIKRRGLDYTWHPDPDAKPIESLYDTLPKGIESPSSAL